MIPNKKVRRKMTSQDKETNGDKEMQANKMDNEKHIKRTVYMGNRLNIPVEESRLGGDNDESTLTTQDTLVKNLVYVTNIQEGKLDTTKNTQDNSKNPSEQDDKKPPAKTSPLEESNSVNSNDNLKAYGESGIDGKPGRDEEHKKKIKNMKKYYIWNLIWMMMWKNNQRMLMM